MSYTDGNPGATVELAEQAGDGEMAIPDDVVVLWSEYVSTRDVELPNRLVLHYSPLVKYVAGRVRSGLPASVEQADLLSEGVMG